MKKKDYFILLVGILFITLVFYKYRELEYALVFSIFSSLLLIALIFFLLMVKESINLKRHGVGAIYIFNCCFINDEVNFLRLFKVITENHQYIKSDSFKMKADEFINYLKEKELLVELDEKDKIEETLEKVNFLLKKEKIELKVDSVDVERMDNEFTKVRRKENYPPFIHDLNVMTTMIREKGYELVQIYPASMYRKKTKYYFIILPIERLLDLGEIGFLG